MSEHGIENANTLAIPSIGPSRRRIALSSYPRAMNRMQLEGLVHEIADRVKAGGVVEDSHVELKGPWITDHAKAARQLAGHCNAALGDHAIWIFGIDEHAGVVGCVAEDMADWWARVRKWFDGTAPHLLIDRAVPIEGKTTVALVFSTDDAPFVVENPLFGSTKGVSKFEVPWREGTAVRAARRADLVRLLGRRHGRPTLSLVSSQFRPSRLPLQTIGEPMKYVWSEWLASAEVAVIAEPEAVLRYLKHKSTVEFDLSTQPDLRPKVSWNISPGDITAPKTGHGQGMRVDGSIAEFRGACTVHVGIDFEFGRDVRHAVLKQCVIHLAPASDEPPLDIALPSMEFGKSDADCR